MAEDVKVPKLGKVNKKVLIPIVVAAGGYIGYRYWVARNDVSGEPVDPGMEDPGMLPGVVGAVKPDNSYGDGGTSDTGGSTGGGFRGTTNSEWTEYVSDRLQQDGRWSYSVIAVALGNFLDNRPLSSEQQDIARAAIGVAGYPPVGNHTIVSGGNTTITVAPTGVVATATGPTTIRLTFSPVAGATTYNAYVNGSAQGTSVGSPLDITGLVPGTSYSVAVAAVSGSGTPGPKSSAVTAKTATAALGRPAQPQIVSDSGDGRVTFKTAAAPHATTYKWFLNGKIFNTTNTPAVTITQLKRKARYSPGVSVQVQGATGAPSAMSITKSFVTK